MENEHYEEILRSDAEAIQEYINKFYSIKVPPPQKPTSKELSFWNIVGLEASLYTISAVASAIVSSIRTGGFFYILEMLLLSKFDLFKNLPIIPQALGTMMWIASLLAFEVVLIGFGISKGREIKNAKTSSIAMFISFAVIVGAGIFNSLGIIELSASVEQYFYISLAILTSFGACLVALFGGENIGFSIEKFKKMRKEILTVYQDEFNAWNLKAVSSYTSSHYARTRKAGQQTPERESKQTFPIPANKSADSKRTGNNRAVIFRLLNELHAQTGNIPRVTETANELALRLEKAGTLGERTVEQFVQDKKGYISKVRREWLEEQGLRE